MEQTKDEKLLTKLYLLWVKNRLKNGWMYVQKERNNLGLYAPLIKLMENGIIRLK